MVIKSFLFVNKWALRFRESSNNILKAFRFSENSAGLFFLLLPHKFSSIAYVKLVLGLRALTQEKGKRNR
jgi:hypothetical protein